MDSNVFDIPAVRKPPPKLETKPSFPVGSPKDLKQPEKVVHKFPSATYGRTFVREGTSQRFEFGEVTEEHRRKAKISRQNCGMKDFELTEKEERIHELMVAVSYQLLPKRGSKEQRRLGREVKEREEKDLGYSLSSAIMFSEEVDNSQLHILASTMETYRRSYLNIGVPILIKKGVSPLPHDFRASHYEIITKVLMLASKFAKSRHVILANIHGFLRYSLPDLAEQLQKSYSKCYGALNSMISERHDVEQGPRLEHWLIASSFTAKQVSNQQLQECSFKPDLRLRKIIAENSGPETQQNFQKYINNKIKNETGKKPLLRQYSTSSEFSQSQQTQVLVQQPVEFQDVWFQGEIILEDNVSVVDLVGLLIRGWFLFLRPSEYAATSIKVLPDLQKQLYSEIFTNESKTDQLALGSRKYVQCCCSEFRWKSRTAQDRKILGVPVCPVCCQTQAKWDKIRMVSTQVLTKCLNRLWELLGFHSFRLMTHVLHLIRIGGASSAADCGMSAEFIRVWGNWKHVESVIHYQRGSLATPCLTRLSRWPAKESVLVSGEGSYKTDNVITELEQMIDAIDNRLRRKLVIGEYE